MRQWEGQVTWKGKELYVHAEWKLHREDYKPDAVDLQTIRVYDDSDELMFPDKELWQHVEEIIQDEEDNRE